MCIRDSCSWYRPYCLIASAYFEPNKEFFKPQLIMGNQSGINTHTFDNAILGLNDFQRMRSHAKTGAGFRYILEVFQHQTIERARAIQRQSEPEFFIDVAQRAGTVHQPATIRLLPVGGVTQRGRGEIADDFLEDVFQRNQAFQLTVFIYHQSDALLLFLKLLQLGIKRGTGGDEIWLGNHFAQQFQIQFAITQLIHDLADVDDADDFFGRPLSYRQSSVMAGGDMLQYGFQRRIKIDRFNLGVGGHHVIHDGFFQIEQVEQDSAVLLGDIAARLHDDTAQLFHADGLADFSEIGLDPEQAQKPADE